MSDTYHLVCHDCQDPEGVFEDLAVADLEREHHHTATGHDVEVALVDGGEA